MELHKFYKWVFTALSVLSVLWLPFFGLHIAYADKILPQVHVGVVSVGGLTRVQASEKLQAHIENLERNGLPLVVDGKADVLKLEHIDLSFPAEKGADLAWQVGRRGNLFTRIKERFIAPFADQAVEAPLELNEQSLGLDTDALADQIDSPRKDLRFQIEGTRVSILTDTKAGRIIDRTELHQRSLAALRNLDGAVIAVALKEDLPRASVESAKEAKREAERMIAAPLLLVYDDLIFTISREELALWLVPGYSGDKLVSELDRSAIGAFVAALAEKVNTPGQKPRIMVTGGKVTEFVPPRPGRGLEQNETIQLIEGILRKRRTSTHVAAAKILLPIHTIKLTGELPEGFEDIVESIGKATTTFAGSPKNRIHNIGNGVRFLTGHLIKPGDEFSTLAALGEVDNKSGYLPEMVIKGSRTQPEFGGGLCQVSTTLFRAALNAGLPITSRRNHSYRVSYYEKDGNGNFIGPGLDATIYQPDLDLKFRNDTGHSILIFGVIAGDKITFELFGTRDGRVSKIEGPKLLAEIPVGLPVYAETNQLPKGVTRQVEIPHPGGTSVATYSVIYPDGTTKTKEFRSYYRQWPARFLVGTGTQQQATAQ